MPQQSRLQEQENKTSSVCFQDEWSGASRSDPGLLQLRPASEGLFSSYSKRAGHKSSILSHEL